MAKALRMLKWALLLSLSSTSFANFNFAKDISFKLFDINTFVDEFSRVSMEEDAWPDNIILKNKSYKLNYTFNENLTEYIKQQLKRYRSDFASVVVIDNNSGQILSAIDYDKSLARFGKRLTFSNTNPAASIFKVITAADLLYKDEIDPKTKFSFRGKATTLYKYQLDDKVTKWSRSWTLDKAFAFSNNVIFGKAAINNTSAKSLYETALKFGFNQSLIQAFDSGSSVLFMPDSQFNLAELASGFNRETLISPVHGAIIASIIANDGVYKKSYFIESITDIDLNRVVWKSNYVLRRSIDKDVASGLQKMMELTTLSGTARGAFRRMNKGLRQNLVIGGKTGSITGGVPYGKRDWFISYAKPRNNSKDKGISVSVMIVNVKKWYIKSTYLAKNIIEYYYKTKEQEKNNE